MERSPYLQEALAMQPSTSSAPEAFDAVAFAQKISGPSDRKRQSLGANLKQAGRNVMALPETMAAIPGGVAGNIAQLPGLFGLGKAAR